MFTANTIAQFLQINYKEPFYAATWLLPLLGAVVYAYYKYQKNNLQTMLLVEDSSTWVFIINTCLKDQYNIKVCQTAEDALRYLEGCPVYELPHKIVIDRNLPGMDGIELFWKISAMNLGITDINIISGEQPGPHDDEKFAEIWVMKSPETFRGPGGLRKALENRPTDMFKDMLKLITQKKSPEEKSKDKSDDK